MFDTDHDLIYWALNHWANLIETGNSHVTIADVRHQLGDPNLSQTRRAELGRLAYHYENLNADQRLQISRLKELAARYEAKQVQAGLEPFDPVLSPALHAQFLEAAAKAAFLRHYEPFSKKARLLWEASADKPHEKVCDQSCDRCHVDKFRVMARASVEAYLGQVHLHEMLSQAEPVDHKLKAGEVAP